MYKKLSVSEDQSSPTLHKTIKTVISALLPPPLDTDACQW